MTTNDIKIPERLVGQDHLDIIKLINKQNVDDVKSGLKCRGCCKCTGDVCEFLGHILIGVAAIISFAAGIWDLNYLAYISGGLSIGSMSLIKFSAYATKESRERTQEINKILTSVQVQTRIPDISTDVNQEI